MGFVYSLNLKKLMIKKLFYITFLFSIILTGNNIASDTDYNICATNADGAILVIENFIK